jgi:hypothetical protein
MDRVVPMDSMKKKHLVLPLVALTLLTVLSACTNYDEGPAVSFRSKFSRVVNNWKAKNIFRDALDVTAWYTNWSMELKEDGRLTVSDLDDQDSVVVQEGFWDLVNKNEDIQFLYTKPVVANDRMTVRILKLRAEELWYEHVTDSATWQFRLVPAASTTE